MTAPRIRTFTPASLAILLVCLFALSRPAASFADPAPGGGFTVDNRLRRNVDFWVDIYTKYDTTQGLIHDSKYIDLVYEVLDLRGVRRTETLIRAAKRKWRQVLLSVHEKQNHPERMTHEERRIFELFGSVSEPDQFRAATLRKRMRFQLGQKDRFREGLFHSGRYLPMMEEIFRKEGVPTELTRLPFVESSFNLNARSKVGASGIWQFMRSTGRLFLKVNDAVDERNDPIRATEAAAKLLKLNYESLRSWPLAVTAYNHGRKGLMRAVRKVGSSELEDVVGQYKSRSFGFASSNFFTELLAAIHVEKNAERYFGKMERATSPDYVEAPIPDSIRLRDLIRFLKLDPSKLRELNPGLTDAAHAGRTPLPAGYRLRLPVDPSLAKDGTLRVFQAGYMQIPALLKGGRQRARKYDTKPRVSRE